MRKDYKTWLEAQKYAANTIASQLHRVGRVEDNYGDLEGHFAADKFEALIELLRYSSEDQRRNKPNPTKLKLDGNVRNSLSSYRSAIARYGRFLSGIESNTGDDGFVQAKVENLQKANVGTSEQGPDQKLSLERDMQAALRRDIKKLGNTLSIIDDGAERSVESGFIDITCEDEVDGSVVVIELKAGKADGKAIGQVLGYMGDLTVEDDSKPVRGILVAHEFDRRAVSASRAVPALKMFKYAVDFRFEAVD